MYGFPENKFPVCIPASWQVETPHHMTGDGALAAPAEEAGPMPIGMDEAGVGANGA